MQPLTPSMSSLDLIKKLIAFDTTSRASNLGLIEWVRDYLAKLGITARFTYDATGKKANLFATLGEVNEASQRAGIVLSGHTDTVPVDGQAWDSNPFQATIKEGKLFARGAADMKSFIAIALAKTPEFIRASRHAPMHLALSYDEEVGCIGVRGLIADLKAQGITPAGCIIGEPTMMQPVIAHKGRFAYVCKVHGKEAHSALAPSGVNAIEYAARLIVYLRHMADRMAQTQTRQYGFSVPYSTLQTGTIQGGIGTNVVPKDCRFSFEFRCLPGNNGQNNQALLDELRGYARTVLLPEMRQVHADADIVFEVESETPGLGMQADAAIVQLAHSLAQSRGQARYVDYGTEGGLFQAAGIPTVVCGPGDIAQAHKPNEFISLEQIAQCELFMDRLMQNQSTQPPFM